MSFGIAAAYACKDLQVDYIDYYGKNSSVFKTGGSTSLIKYLLSPQNTRGFKKIDVTSIPGKKRGVAFMVDQPYCFDLCNPAVTCQTVKTAMTNLSNEIVFDLSDNAFRHCDGDGDPMVLQFTREDLARYCTKDDMSYVKNQIIRYLMRFEEALDKKLATLISVAAGKNYDGDSITRLPFFVSNTITNTSNINPDAMWWLNQHYLNASNDGQFALVGGLALNKIISFQRWAGLNMGGIDLAKIDDINPYAYYDRHFDGIIGMNQFLQLAPGAVQLVTYNENAGPYKTEVTDLYSNGTITLPSSGLTIDWDWRYDYDCKAWKFEAYLHAELAVNRPGGCGTLAETNGIILFEDCSNSTAQPVCPEEPAE